MHGTDTPVGFGRLSFQMFNFESVFNCLPAHLPYNMWETDDTAWIYVASLALRVESINQKQNVYRTTSKSVMFIKYLYKWVMYLDCKFLWLQHVDVYLVRSTGRRPHCITAKIVLLYFLSTLIKLPIFIKRQWTIELAQAITLSSKSGIKCTVRNFQAAFVRIHSASKINCGWKKILIAHFV